MLKLSLPSFLTFLLLCSEWGQAKIVPPNREDMDGWAEHLVESIQNSRFISLPWSTFSFQQQWGQIHLQVGKAENEAGILKAQSDLFSLAGYWRGPKSNMLLGLQVFNDKIKFSSTRPVQNYVWIPLIKNPMPLDVPEYADFRNPRGEGRQRGIGPSLSYMWKYQRYLLNWSQSLLYEELDIKKFQLDFTLTGGQDAGTSGTIDYAFKEFFILYMGDLKLEYLFGNSLLLAPHFTYVLPVPRRTFHSHITTAQLDLVGDTKNAGNGVHMVDPFASLGLNLEHKGAHLSWDVGAFLLYPSWEKFFDYGITQVTLYSGHLNFYF